MAKITDELKWAITRMPAIEKDKLLLRLISKDAMLIAKLQHQLLETDKDMLRKREELLQQITDGIGHAQSYYYTPGLLMMGMRDANGHITRHVKITKDNLGEIQLTVDLVNVAFDNHIGMLMNNATKAQTFADYVVKKADFVLKKLQKIHEDYYIEFEESVNKMLQNIHNYKPCTFPIKEMKIPATWHR